MIASETTPARDPGQAAFDDPPSGQDLKPSSRALLLFLVGRLVGARAILGRNQPSYHLHAPSQMVLDPFDESAAIMTIPPQQLHMGKQVLEWLKDDLSSL